MENRPAEAAVRLYTALAIHPTSASAYANLAAAITPTGRGRQSSLAKRSHRYYAIADEEFLAALATEPTNAALYYGLARARLAAYNVQGSIEPLLRAASLRPSHAATYRTLGRALQDVRRPKEAVAASRVAVSLTSGAPEVEAELAVAEQNLLDERASERRTEVLRSRTGDAQASHELGTLLMRLSSVSWARPSQAVTGLDQPRSPDLSFQGFYDYIGTPDR